MVFLYNEYVGIYMYGYMCFILNIVDNQWYVGVFSYGLKYCVFMFIFF